MDNQKFLGICIVIAAVILAAAVGLHARNGRYQLQKFDDNGVGGKVLYFDSWTGQIHVGDWSREPVTKQ